MIINLKESLSKKLNPIDLFVVFDLSDSIAGARLVNLKKALFLIIDALDSNDRLSLISFSTKTQTLSELSYMNDGEKNKQRGIVELLRAGGGTYFKEPIHLFLKGIEKSYSTNNGRVQSVLFFTDGDSLNHITPKEAFRILYRKNYDFTVHTFLLGNEGNSKNLMEFANYRGGGFYFIEDSERIRDYVMNIIGGLKQHHIKMLMLIYQVIILLLNFMKMKNYLILLIKKILIKLHLIFYNLFQDLNIHMY